MEIGRSIFTAIVKKLVAPFDIPAKEQIGRAKFVDADKYVEGYAAISAEMAAQIQSAVEKGGADV